MLFSVRNLNRSAVHIKSTLKEFIEIIQKNIEEIRTDKANSTYDAPRTA
jgi:hypothetical protein